MSTDRHNRRHHPVARLTLLTACALALLSAFAAAAFAGELPDGRVYEMVTPVENYNSEVYIPLGLPPAFVDNAGETETKLPFQVAINGEAVAYAGDPSIGGTGNSGLGEGNEYLSTRIPNGGWRSPINIQPAGVNSAFYQAFSPNLTLGILDSGSAEEPEIPALSKLAPGDGYAVLYTRAFDGDDYQPFFTTLPPNLAPQEFKTFEVPKTYPTSKNQLAYAGASSDFKHLLFEANDALTANAVDGGIAKNNLYESFGDRLSLVNILPDGSTEAGATFGAKALEREVENPPNFSDVISSDGSRIFWTNLNSGKEGLYVSEDVGSPAERTVQIDASQVSGGKGGGGRFWAASKDGSKVFFTDSYSAKLTSNTQVGSGENLYMYEVATGRLVDLTARSSAEVVGVLGEGENNNSNYTIYFTAKGVLTTTPSATGATPESGANNLYMLEEDKEPKFIAVLSEEDGSKDIKPLSPSGLEKYGDWQVSSGRRTAEVTPDGRSLVFMSNNQRFEEGHVEEAGGVSLEEVYIYEAEGDRLWCASCSREGIKPQINLESEEGLGAYLPVSQSNTYLPIWVSEDGSHVFFDSDQPLVSSDTNGEQDVYEWEHEGVGECKESSGCVYLLSGGTSKESSWLIGASASGDDVFIITRARLVPEDTNEAYDLYDARVGGVPSIIAPACMGTGCQGVVPAPPVFATPASETFSGVGNAGASNPVQPVVKKKTVKCAKGEVRKGTKCIKSKKQQQRKKAHGKAKTSLSRGTSR